MIFGEESQGLLIAAVGDVPAGTFREEPHRSLERMVSQVEYALSESHGP